jgi:G3E family GTPase
MGERVYVPGGVIERFGDGWCARLGDGSSSTLVGFYRTREEAAHALASRCERHEGDWPRRRVPFTVLTGFLGAGKTTTLNRVLRATDRRLAVLVNDVGRINIDRALIVARDADVVELSGGCVCCSFDVQKDLWENAVELTERARPDQLILETTGIAEPHVILEQLSGWPHARERLFAAGVACVVDAEDGGRWIDDRGEAREQVADADRLLLTKLDVASRLATARVHLRLRELRPELAPVAFPQTGEGDRALASWLLDERPIKPRLRHDDAHRHGQLDVLTFVEDSPLLSGPLLRILERLGPALLRAKGFVHLAGEPRQGFLERAGQRLELRHGDPWGVRPRRSELVLIGVGLDERALRAALWGKAVG